MIRHAGLLATLGARGWRGVLIEGASGAGKSDLMLRALAAGFRLVADDRTLLWTSQGRLFGRAPDPLHGLIEVRGVGVVREPALRFCEVALLARPGDPERMPEPCTEALLEIEVPVLELGFFEASAAAKLGRALANFDAGHKRRM